MNTLITGSTKFYSQTQNKEYIELLRKNPPFTPEEEREAFKRLKNGDETALDEIVVRNQRWVYSVAKEFARDEIEVMDYVQEGNLGLMEAIEKYDVDRGLKFITYAVWYMRREMNAHMNNERDIVAKSNNAKYGKKLEKIKNEFFVQNGYKPSLDEIKELFQTKYDITINDIRDLYDMEVTSISENFDDETTTFEGSNEFVSVTASENLAIADEDKEYFKELVVPILGCLPKEHQEFIKKLYHIGYDEDYSIEQICNDYRMNEQQLKAMEKNILEYMRGKMLYYYKKAI